MEGDEGSLGMESLFLRYLSGALRITCFLEPEWRILAIMMPELVVIVARDCVMGGGL